MISPSAQRLAPSAYALSILIVRLGSLGDIVHGLPVAAALREAYPLARIDWLADRRHLDLLALVPVIDRAVALERPTVGGWVQVVRELRQTPYDVALDLQGLLKSAVLARLSGAARVIGFETSHLRERTARPFYSETVDPGEGGHVVYKNVALAGALEIAPPSLRFPLRHTDSQALAAVSRDLDGAGLAQPATVAGAGSGPMRDGAVGERRPREFALINPGAAWPNKRWPPDRFGRVAAFLRDRYALASVVLWGPGEEPLARAVAAASGGAARLAPETTIADLVELSRAASLMVSGDTGPLHIAAAVGTPVVGVFGPTDPRRNGPWSGEDEVVSRWAQCDCPYERRCRRRAWCLADITVDEVTGAIERRMATHRP